MKGLKKAAIQYADNAEKVAGCGYEFQTEELTEAFIAGAQWQKQKDMQDESDIAVIAALDGAARGKKIMKEQMMKDAIEREVKIDAGGYPYIPQIELYDYEKDVPLAKAGDKVKVIIMNGE